MSRMPTSNISEAALDVRLEILEKLQRDLNLPMNVIRAVVDNQFKTAVKAFKTETSIEIAGFGRFTLREVRIDRLLPIYQAKIVRYDDFIQSVGPSWHSKELTIEKRDTLQKYVNDLIHKKDVFQTKRNSRRVEE